MWEITLLGEVFNPKLGFKEWQEYRKKGCVAVFNMLGAEPYFIDIIARNCKSDKELFKKFQWIICDKSQQKFYKN